MNCRTPFSDVPLPLHERHTPALGACLCSAHNTQHLPHAFPSADFSNNATAGSAGGGLAVILSELCQELSFPLETRLVEGRALRACASAPVALPLSRHQWAVLGGPACRRARRAARGVCWVVVSEYVRFAV